MLTITAFAATAVLAMAQPSVVADDAATGAAHSYTYTDTLHYLMWLPDGYDDAKAEPEGGWPLVLFLHGAGERGDDLERVKAWGPPRMAAAGESLPYILVAPQCPQGRWWQTPPLLALLDDITERYKVDPDRVYVTGLSMGGFGTWNLAAADPGRFAAIAPVCGGSSAPMLRLDGLKDLPIWAFHGGDDPVVPPSETLRAVEAVRRLGGQARLTIYEGVGHDSWRNAYAEDELWTWMLAQRRHHADTP